jgi:hypothetical protein
MPSETECRIQFHRKIVSRCRVDVARWLDGKITMSASIQVPGWLASSLVLVLVILVSTCNITFLLANERNTSSSELPKVIDSDQLADRRAGGENWHRAALVIGE